MNFYDTSRLPRRVARSLIAAVRLYSNVIFSLYALFSKKTAGLKAYQKSRPLGPRSTICFAPNKSMYFGTNGNVVACCLNRSHIFGKYPAQNLREIWQGAPVKELRNALKKSDFSKGCYHCSNRIQGGNYDAVEAMLYDKIPLRKNFPSMLVFELDNECNLQCIMCSPEFSSAISRNVEGKNTVVNPYDDNFLQQLDEFLPHLTIAKFLGGEPFLIPIYYKIWAKLIRQNPDCIIMVQTNATVLNEKIRDLLSHGNFRISVSLESFRKGSYETIRKNGDYEKMMENIRYFSEQASRNNYYFGISICPIRQNWQELPEIVTMCNELDAWIYFNTVWTPYDCSLFTLSHDELKAVIGELSTYAPPDDSACKRHNKYHFECFINQMKAWYAEKLDKHEQRSKRAAMLAEQHAELKNMLHSEIIESVIQHIRSGFGNEFDEVTREKKLKEYHQKLYAVADRLKEDKYMKQALSRLMDYPPLLLMQEIENNNTNTLCSKAQDVIREVKNETENIG